MDQYACPLCGNMVSKRKSYLYQGSRVCKCHNLKDEIAPKKETLQSFEMLTGSESGSETWEDCHCWCCSKYGVTIENYWKYLEITPLSETVLDMLDQASLKRSLPLISIHGIRKCDSGRVINNLKHKAFMSGRILMCTKCAKEQGFSTTFLVSAKANLEPEDIQKLQELLPFDISEIEKHLESI